MRDPLNSRADMVNEIADRVIDNVRKGDRTELLRTIDRFLGAGPWVDIREFHKKFGVPVPEVPTLPPHETIMLRARLIAEECRETLEALGFDVTINYVHNPEAKPQVAHIVHECIDNIVVSMGTIISCGVDFCPAWNAVHSANMQKMPNPDGGKILKPPGWTPANMQEVVDRQILAS